MSCPGRKSAQTITLKTPYFIVMFFSWNNAYWFAVNMSVTKQLSLIDQSLVHCLRRHGLCPYVQWQPILLLQHSCLHRKCFFVLTYPLCKLNWCNLLQMNFENKCLQEPLNIPWWHFRILLDHFEHQTIRPSDRFAGLASPRQIRICLIIYATCRLLSLWNNPSEMINFK